MILRQTFLTLTLAAGSLFATDPTLLKLVPSDPAMVAALDCERAKGSALGQKILAEMKDEDSGFRKFVEATGFDPRRDLREVLVVATPGDPKTQKPLVAVTGTFDPTKISAFLRGEGGVQSFYSGVELWKNPKNDNGAIALVNGTLTLFGKEDVVKAAIDRRNAGGSAIPSDLQQRINTWSANDAWFVSTASLTQMGINADGKNKVMPGNIPVEAIQAASAGVRFGSDLQIAGEALTRSDKDAQALVDVFRFVASMVRLNSDKPNADQLVKIFDTMQLSTSGATMKFSITVPEEQFDNIFQHRAQRTRARAALNHTAR